MSHAGMLIDYVAARRYLSLCPPSEIHLPPISPAPDKALVSRLTACLQAAKRAQPSAFQATGEWRAILDENEDLRRESLRTMFRDVGQTVIGANFSARALDRPSLKGTIKKPFILKGIHQDLRIWRSVIDHPDIRDLAAPDIGSPWGGVVEGTLVYPGVCRAHYFASQAANLLGHSGTIAELGGGYGEFAYRLLKANPNIRYIDFDLPEVLFKASYFLMSAFPEKRFLLFDEIGDRPLTNELVRQYDIVLMPNFMLPKLESADLFINTRSLSEMSRPTIEGYLREIFRVTRRYFLHENSNEAVETRGGHIEIPASQFPIDSMFRRIYAHKSPWWAGQGFEGRYVEYLYERHTE